MNGRRTTRCTRGKWACLSRASAGICAIYSEVMAVWSKCGVGGMAVDEPAAGVGSCGPDEVEVPPSLRAVEELGIKLTEEEIDSLMRFVDRRRGEAAAHAVWTWSPADWVNVLLDEMRRKARGSD